MPSQALYEKPIPVMEPPSPPDPIPVTTTEKITAAAKLAALMAKEILEVQRDAKSLPRTGSIGSISSTRFMILCGFQSLHGEDGKVPHSRIVTLHKNSRCTLEIARKLDKAENEDGMIRSECDSFQRL